MNAIYITSETSPATSPNKSRASPSAKRRRLSSSQETLWINPDFPSATCSSTSPSEYLQVLLSKHEIKKHISPAFSLEKYFITPSEEHFSSYKEDVISALRQRDINTLKKIANEEGRSLQCCNRFGESLIHMACRRGFADVVTFLIEEGVSLKVIDDYGRTPMHDAFWTAKPNFELVRILITEEPSLLFVSDRRGHIPLDYVRKNDSHWTLWNKFLESHMPSILKHMPETQNISALQ